LWKYRGQHTVSTAKGKFPEKLPFANNGIFSLKIRISYQIENSATNKRFIFRPPYFVEIQKTAHCFYSKREISRKTAVCE